VALAELVDFVIATDASAGQLAAARRHEQVRYVRAPAENAPIATATADLVTAAQALRTGLRNDVLSRMRTGPSSSRSTRSLSLRSRLPPV
jgi:ubiquinone/menaquinone biosynthesis C-methylase UbiE